MDLATISTLISEHRYLPLAAMLIGYVVRQLKADALGPVVPSKYRRPLAFGLGLAMAMLDLVLGGASWWDALAVAMVSPLLAIAGHHLGVDKLRGGREMPLPAMLMRKPSGGGPGGPASVALLLLVTGCAGSFEESRIVNGKLGAAPPPSVRCISLDDSHRTWGAVAKGSAVLAGASGLAQLPLQDEGKGARIGVAAGGLAFAALGASAVVLSEGAAASWARECR